MKFFLLLLLSINTLFALVNLEPNMQKKNNFIMESFYDDSNSINIKDIESKVFTQTRSQFTFGFAKGTLWLKLSMKNNTLNEDFVLNLTEAYFDEVILYEKKDNSWKKELIEICTPLKARAIKNHTPAFAINIKNKTTKTVYIKIHSKISLVGELEIYTKDYFSTLAGHTSFMLYLLYFGSILIISLISLLVYIRIRDIIYLYYAGYTFFFILGLTAYSGILLYTGIDIFYYKILMTSPIFAIFFILFSSKILNIQNSPKIGTVINILIGLLALLSILVIKDFEPWYSIMNTLLGLLFLVIFATALFIYKKTKDINAKYYSYALGVYMLNALLLLVMSYGLVENNNITRYAFLFSTLFEMLVFILILTNRFYVVQKEKLLLQKKLLTLKMKNEVILEQEIKNKTRDIANLLGEKELLLKELYHRVKNNFHTLVGLLWMEEKNEKEIRVKKVFLKLINRVKSISLVHQYLHDSDLLSKIDATQHINKIVQEIKIAYSEQNIKIDKNITSIALDLDSAMSLGIIINELLNNSVKYMPENKICHIEISLSKENNLATLIVKDNGFGFERNDINEFGLGLKLIEQFSKKLLNSKFEFTTNNGTIFKLFFELNSLNDYA